MNRDTRLYPVLCALTMTVLAGCGGGGDVTAAAPLAPPVAAPAPPTSFKALVLAQFDLGVEAADTAAPASVDELPIAFEDRNDVDAYSLLLSDDI